MRPQRLVPCFIKNAAIIAGPRICRWTENPFSVLWQVPSNVGRVIRPDAYGNRIPMSGLWT